MWVWGSAAEVQSCNFGLICDMAYQQSFLAREATPTEKSESHF